MGFLKTVGNNSARQLSPEYHFDPELGYTTVEVWEGSEDALQGIAAQYAAGRFRYRLYNKEGPVWRAEFNRTPTEAEGADDVIDEWEFDRDYGQEDIRHSPKVVAQFGSAYDMASTIKEIEDAIRDASVFTPQDDFETILYNNMLRGQTSYQSYNVVLRRVRTVPIQYAGAASQDAIPIVYSGSALVGAFDIPSNIAGRMPGLPDYTPPSTFWGWLQRQDQTKFLPRRGRAQESREWIFAAWSELTYDFVF